VSSLGVTAPPFSFGACVNGNGGQRARYDEKVVYMDTMTDQLAGSQQSRKNSNAIAGLAYIRQPRKRSFAGVRAEGT
jgi:hypothetical protein